MFHLKSLYSPKGDQPKAIASLSKGVLQNKKFQVLLGITGSGKTFTMANIIAQTQKPALILAHNKTLAAQLYQEFKGYFPNNAVEYFVSYYDYYQPEAYIARTDTYIEKDMAINDHIDKMRLSATRSLIERKDVIIVSSVSCIYGLGLPEYYSKMVLHLQTGQSVRRDDILFHLIQLHYTRSEYDLSRGNFRARGDVLEIVPAYEDNIAYRIEFFGDEIERISTIDPLTGKIFKRQEAISIYPGSHHVIPEQIRFEALQTIREELKDRSSFFAAEDKLIEKQRIEERTKYDLEMIKEAGFCKGIENYSRHFSKRMPGKPPSCLLDYFPKDYLFFVDESHQTIPQIRAMYHGDFSRKKSLVEFGFRLPSAFDNRPLKFEEVYEKFPQVIFVSATPGNWEIEQAEGQVVEQIIRPTGLLDPIIQIKKAVNQVDDALEEIRIETDKNRRILVTTLTKKLSEDLTKYLLEIGVKAKYIHSDIDTLERSHIIKDLRKGVFDVLVGINLLREGLDIPEVSLVLILDADKQGFLRSETALIQTCGRAARNIDGRVIMYADKKTEAIAKCLAITQYRRKMQKMYNEENNITPHTVKKEKIEGVDETFGITEEKIPEEYVEKAEKMTLRQLEKKIKETKNKMQEAASNLDFEKAANYRDQLKHFQELELKKLEFDE